MQFQYNLCDPERSVPHEGKDYRFTCQEKADDETTFACTGSEHRDGLEIVCTCECHDKAVTNLA